MPHWNGAIEEINIIIYCCCYCCCCRREVVPLPRLQLCVLDEGKSQGAHAPAHGSEAVQVSALQPALPYVRPSQEPHPAAPQAERAQEAARQVSGAHRAHGRRRPGHLATGAAGRYADEPESERAPGVAVDHGFVRQRDGQRGDGAAAAGFGGRTVAAVGESRPEYPDHGTRAELDATDGADRRRTAAAATAAGEHQPDDQPESDQRARHAGNRPEPRTAGGDDLGYG